MFCIASNYIAGIFKFRIDLKQFQTFETHDLVFIEALASASSPQAEVMILSKSGLLPGV